MHTIHRFVIPTTSHSIVQMPRNAKILTAGLSLGEKPCIWAMVDTANPLVDRFFMMYTTGAPFPLEPGSYIGTFILSKGAYVLHLFEET